jgi:hypothetical protein
MANRVSGWIEAKQMGLRVEGCLPCHPIFCRMPLDHPFDHPDDPSVSVWTDDLSNVSRLDPSGAD